MVMILLVCILSNETAYLYKVWLKYLQLDERYGLDTIFIEKITRNVIPFKMEPELWFLFTAALLMFLHLCTKFQENIFIILKIRSGNNVCIKGHNSVKSKPELLVSVQLLSLNLAC